MGYVEDNLREGESVIYKAQLHPDKARYGQPRSISRYIGKSTVG